MIPGRCGGGCGATGGGIFTSRSTPLDDFLRDESASLLILVVFAALEFLLPLRLEGCFGAGAGGGVGGLPAGGPLSDSRFIIAIGLLALGGGGGGAAIDSWLWVCE